MRFNKLLHILLLSITTLIPSCVASGEMIPLNMGKDFMVILSDMDLLRGFKLNTNGYETPFKRTVFEGEMYSKKFTNTPAARSLFIESTEDLKELMEISGALSVTYGPIHGEASGSYLGKTVSSTLQRTLVYSSQQQAFFKAVDVDTLKFTDKFKAQGEKALDVYGTKFVEKIIYGAQLDVYYTVSADTEEEVLEIGAKLSGAMNKGVLNIDFNAEFGLNETSSDRTMKVDVQVSAFGTQVEIPAKATWEDIKTIVDDFNEKYQQEYNLMKNLPNLDDYMSNSLTGLTPIGFVLGSIADYYVPDKKFELSKSDVAFVDRQMEIAGDIFVNSMAYERKLEAARETNKAIYTDPRDKAELFNPYSHQVEKTIDILRDQQLAVKAFRALKLEEIVGLNGAQPAELPEAYPVDAKILDGLLGHGYIQSPATIGDTTFDGLHYEGYIFYGDDGIPNPVMKGSLSRDKDDKLVATGKRPALLERKAFTEMNKVPGSENEITYGDRVYLQWRGQNSRWLSSTKEQDDTVTTQKHFDFGNWTFHKDLSNEVSRECLKYGDQVFLRHQEDGVDRWLTRGVRSNVAREGTAKMGCENGDENGPEKAIDGDTTGKSGITICNDEPDNNWWEVELDEAIPIHSVKIFNRKCNSDPVCATRLGGFKVEIYFGRYVVEERDIPPLVDEEIVVEFDDFHSVMGDKVRISREDGNSNMYLNIFEVEVYKGLELTKTADLEDTNQQHAARWTLMSAPQYFVVSDGKECPLGSEIASQEDCQSVGVDLGGIQNKNQEVVVVDQAHVEWAVAPCGCFWDPIKKIHFKDCQIDPGMIAPVSGKYSSICQSYSDADPIEGKCIQSSEQVYFQEDRYTLQGAVLSGLTEDTFQKGAFYSNSLSNIRDAQWILRHNHPGNGRTDNALVCAAQSASGKWVKLDQGVQNQNAIIWDSHSSFSGWTKNNLWKKSVATTVQKGFKVEGTSTKTVEVEDALYSYGIANSAERVMDVDEDVFLWESLTGGQVWQFVLSMTDNCASWDLKLGIADGGVVVNEDSKEAVPCCLPGFFINDNDPHGPCKTDSPCLCNAEVCDRIESKTEPPLCLQGCICRDGLPVVCNDPMPTNMPSDIPSELPTVGPTHTSFPSNVPSPFSPSVSPSATPSASPSSTPSVSPSLSPSASPSATPTKTPTKSPTTQCVDEMKGKWCINGGNNCKKKYSCKQYSKKRRCKKKTGFGNRVWFYCKKSCRKCKKK